MIRRPPTVTRPGAVATSGEASEVVAFVAELHRQEAAAKTVQNYRSDLACFGRWFAATNGAAFAAAAVTPTDVRDYRSYLIHTERRTPATVNRRLAALRKFFAWARATELVAEEPTVAVKGVDSTLRAPKALQKRELDKLARTVERHGSTRDQAVMLTLRHTGLRVSELCALHLADLALAERSGAVVVRSGKGSKYRTVPLNVDARRALTAYLAVRPAVSDEHVSIGQRRGGLRPTAVEDLDKKYARLAGLTDVTPHTLRHSFGKHLLDAGENLVAVAALLGHSRLETTAIYTHPSDRDLERALERLERDAV